MTAGRQAYLDWVRGVAVLIMIEAHALDSWTMVADRRHPGFGYAMMLGGLGAPLFLFLAGVSVVLSAASKFRTSDDLAHASRAVRRRGWQICGLAFLFRLQSFVLGGGKNAAGILKVDILNIMGPSVVAAAVLWGVLKRRTAAALPATAVFAGVAAGIAMLTPIVRTTSWLNWLPDPLEWYFRPIPGRTNFTLFPWAGFTFAGAAVGVVVEAAREARAWRLQLGLAAAGIVAGVAAYWASFLPSIYAASEFWTSSPTFFFLRAGLLLTLLPLGYLWVTLRGRSRLPGWSPVEILGRSSLFVYWVHVEIAYGGLSRPLQRRLSFEAAVLAFVVFSGFMLGLVLLKNRLLAPRDAGSLGPSSAQTASI